MESKLSTSPKFHYQYVSHIHAKIVAVVDAICQKAHSTSTTRQTEIEYQLPLLTLPTSILISAPKGAGKTVYLQSLIEFLRATSASSHQELIVITSCKTISKLQYSTYQQTKLFIESQFPLLVEFEQHLFLLLQLLFGYSTDNLHALYDTQHGNYTETSLKQVVYICLDDLDSMFSVFASGLDNDQDNILLDNEHTRMMKLIAYHIASLQRTYESVISYKGEENQSTAQLSYILLLIGTSTYARNDLPRKQLGCPEYELYLSFWKPNDNDLFIIWSEVLSKTFSFLLLESINDLIDSKEEEVSDSTIEVDQVLQRIRWSKRLAKLTKGYYYGDIMDVTHQALLYYQGQKSLQSNNLFQLDNTQRFNWQTMLDALASVPLKALSQLDFLSSSSSSSSSTMKGKQVLSWTNFYGYEELKHQLRQRLLPYFTSLSGSSSESTVGSNPLFQQAISLLPKGMVIHGPSGCGKTYLAKILAHEVSHFLLNIKAYLIF
jgi:hypothetical protein